MSFYVALPKITSPCCKEEINDSPNMRKSIKKMRGMDLDKSLGTEGAGLLRDKIFARSSLSFLSNEEKG